jgi:predicted PurR-regulated permease PerM
MEKQIKIPFYVKTAMISVSLFALVYTLHIGQHIIVPILFSAIIAILLNPIVNFLIGKRLNKVLAISLVALFATIVLVFIGYFASTQMNMFSDTYPQLKIKFSQTSDELIAWASGKFNIKATSISKWISENRVDAIANFSYSEKITEAGRMLFVGLLIPVYVFLILYYKSFLLEFIRKLFRTEHQAIVVEVLTGTKTIIQSYIVGLFIELLIVAVLNSVGLLLLGIQYAIILGIIGAFLNLVPYVGGIIAIALPMIIAFVTKDSISAPLMVLLVYLFIQLIDNNLLIPKVVAKRVQINALVSVVVVIIGGTLWGIPGMFLSIPLTAIVKVIFDHIEPLKPWGFLLGNIVPTNPGFSFVRKKLKNKI